MHSETVEIALELMAHIVNHMEDNGVIDGHNLQIRIASDHEVCYGFNDAGFLKVSIPRVTEFGSLEEIGSYLSDRITRERDEA